MSWTVDKKTGQIRPADNFHGFRTKTKSEPIKASVKMTAKTRKGKK